MIISILSEPRSGSTNLYHWLKLSLPDFIVLNEPYNFLCNDFKTKIHYNTDWIEFNKNYIINEKFYPNCGDLTQLMNISDKVICLYRKNSRLQIESYIIAEVTDNWTYEYMVDNRILDKIDGNYLDKKLYFERLKQEFKEFRLLHDLKSFTYEDLFYGNQIEELKEYLGFQIKTPFPYGKKYRIERKIEKLI